MTNVSVLCCVIILIKKESGHLFYLNYIKYYTNRWSVSYIKWKKNSCPVRCDRSYDLEIHAWPITFIKQWQSRKQKLQNHTKTLSNAINGETCLSKDSELSHVLSLLTDWELCLKLSIPGVPVRIFWDTPYSVDHGIQAPKPCMNCTVIISGHSYREGISLSFDIWHWPSIGLIWYNII